MSEFTKLAEEGKYHQLSQAILKTVESMPSDELKNVYETVVVPNHYNLHANSFAEISASIAKKLGKEDSLRLLENALYLLVSVGSVDADASIPLITRASKLAKEGNESILRILLEIACMKVSTNEISEARIILYDCKELQIESKESLRKLHLGLGLMHYSTKNYAPAYKNLLEYLKLQNKDKDVFQTCLISGILSDNVYSFASLIDIFKDDSFTSLSLATALESGNSEEAVKISMEIDKSLASTVERKAAVIRLLNYFFSNQQRSVRLQDIADSLNIPRIVVEETVLRILGSGLMKGTIDGITGEFAYTWIGYKHLTQPEITSIRNVISEIRSRVDAVRQEIEQKK
ncbi:26S proteasome regulatory subunit N9 [Nematocida minor]|uniref:26S proteasome regulatory subunit N9 n=1 Tax=Nematocida minor TaxID=1912983 RepID=UPI00221E38DF|nr:26S proteasome regulatory subunit N9 [Nematocida minor]KAI5189117.1 26S proteasome regulatory subunit N9 [Nematocida minor]